MPHVSVCAAVARMSSASLTGSHDCVASACTVMCGSCGHAQPALVFQVRASIECHLACFTISTSGGTAAVCS
jgi:hypothetical protein